MFRVSRITDVTAIGAQDEATRPDGVDLRALVERSIDAATGGQSGGVARVWAADGHGTALRRAGRVIARRTVGGRDGDVIETDVASLDGLAREIAGYGPDVLVLEPDSLRSDVVARLTAQAGVRA